MIGKLYGENLKAKGAAPRHRAQAKQVADELVANGADDMSEDGFARRVQTWVNEMMAARRGDGDADAGFPGNQAAEAHDCPRHRASGHEDGRQAPALGPVSWRSCYPRLSAAKSRYSASLSCAPCSLMSPGIGPGSSAARWRTPSRRQGATRPKPPTLSACTCATVYNRLRMEDAEDSWWLYAALGVYTGARPSEVQYLRWEVGAV